MHDTPQDNPRKGSKAPDPQKSDVGRPDTTQENARAGGARPEAPNMPGASTGQSNVMA